MRGSAAQTERAAPPTVGGNYLQLFKHLSSVLPVLPFCTADGWKFAAIIFAVVFFILSPSHLPTSRRDTVRDCESCAFSTVASVGVKAEAAVLAL